MARDSVTPTQLSPDGDTAEPAGVAINVTNGIRVVVGKQRKTIIEITNTSAATKTVAVRKSTNAAENPVSDHSTASIAATTGKQILGPISARFIQSDGTVWLDFVSGHTGVVRAYELP